MICVLIFYSNLAYLRGDLKFKKLTHPIEHVTVLEIPCSIKSQLCSKKEANGQKPTKPWFRDSAVHSELAKACSSSIAWLQLLGHRFVLKIITVSSSTPPNWYFIHSCLTVFVCTLLLKTVLSLLVGNHVLANFCKEYVSGFVNYPFKNCQNVP